MADLIPAPHPCAICGAPFTVPPKRLATAKYCSNKCGGRAGGRAAQAKRLAGKAVSK